MPQVIVQQVLQGPVAGKPFPSHGKMIEVTEWLVNALVDGQPVQNVKLRAFSPKVLWIVFAGSTMVCDPPRMHQNQIEYKITTPSDANGHVNEQQGAPAQQPVYVAPQQSLMPPVVTQQPPHWAQPAPVQTRQPVAPPVTQVNQPVQSRPPYVPPPSYTREEYEDLLVQGIKFARDTFDKKTDPAVIASFAATYVIGATRLGIKIKTQAPVKATTNDTEAMWELIFDKGLGERVQNANIEEPVLLSWFTEAGKNANMFCTRLNYELKKIESGAVKEE